MEKKDLITDELLSHFSNGDELFDFLGEVQKPGIEKLLEAELDVHLDYVFVFLTRCLELWSKNTATRHLRNTYVLSMPVKVKHSC